VSAASWERAGVVGMDALALAKPARFVPRQPGTILRWHRAGFRAYWRWKSRGQSGRPRVSVELRKSSIASDLTYDLRSGDPDFIDKIVGLTFGLHRLLDCDHSRQRCYPTAANYGWFA
jgi:hypothetical protein